MLQPQTVQPLATKVVCLTQVVTGDELKDDYEYEDILEDMRTEGAKFGKVAELAIYLFISPFSYESCLHSN